MDELTEALERYRLHQANPADLDKIYHAAHAYAEGRLPADFPTDEDVEVAARAIEQAGFQFEITDEVWDTCKTSYPDQWSEMLRDARAALLAVAERRRR